jgi:polyisoprenoid-binding protein YceI
MKRIILYTGMLAMAMFLSSCGGEQETENTPEKETCFYHYNSGSTVLEWTAFKFTEKAPVNGTFNEITYEGETASDDLETLVKSMAFTIKTSSVETQNEERNGKIAKLFFETIGTPVIKAKVLKLENGKATLEIMMNNLSKEVIAEYTLENNIF